MNCHCHFTNKTIEHSTIVHIFLPLNNQTFEHFAIEQMKKKKKTSTNELASTIDQMKEPFGNENELM